MNTTPVLHAHDVDLVRDGNPLLREVSLIARALMPSPRLLLLTAATAVDDVQ
ncbi:hypothetical protein ACFFS2_26730 [Streptomyces aurantiacus]|uniref:Uncharacterized protein n=1 Tax=Streptomyces aurantiacus TaxID=47760 RepID=A0A7G1P420_9ACTN|nr:hypothetical protein [Streptomyces aurantiacus]BCL29742.1 hypothetical protein GCM10017557_46010 [Streptomyces aurantiacus]